MIKRRILAAVLWLMALAGLSAIWLLNGSLLWPGVLLVLLFLPFLSALLLLAIRRRISLTLSLDPMTQKEQEAAGVLHLKNASFFSVRVLISLQLDNELTGETGETELSGAAGPHNTADIPFCLKSSRCGRIRVKVRHLRLLDLAGFLTVPVKGEMPGESTTFLPLMFPSEADLLLSAAVSDDNETYDQNRSGYDFTELFQLREYVPGDSLHKIHWKLTAKTDELIVREGSLPLQRSLLVFWDKASPGKMSPDEADALAESVSSVSQNLSESGYAYTLGWSEGENKIFREIHTADELLTSLPYLVAGGGEERGGHDGAAEEGGKIYGTILLFSHSLPENLDSLCRRSRVVLLLCSREEAKAPCRLIRFTPKDYADRLQNLELTE